MASVRKRGKVWYYRFVDADGIPHERKGCGDRRETESMGATAEVEAAKIKAGLIDPKALGYREHESRTLADHAEDFRAHLLAKGGTAKHALVSVNRVTRLLDLARIRRISELSPSKVQAALATLRSEGLSQESINHHVRAVKGFSRWLWRDNRAREHSLAHLATTSSEADRRRRRRALTTAEASRLIQAAEVSKKSIGGLTGPARARLYSIALGTGFRASELASLTPERFNMTGNPPTATIAACYAKNGREAAQPIPHALADRLAPWLATLPEGKPIFGRLRRTADMIRADLADAGIEYETASGVVDFHALRGCYISYVVTSGASVKVCQDLARHSTPSLTIGVYAKAALHDIQGALEALPDQNVSIATNEILSSTGTESQPIKERFAHPWPISGVGNGRNLSERGTFEQANMKSNDVLPMVRKPLQNEGLDVSRRGLSGRVGGEKKREAAVGVEPTVVDLQSTALPLGYAAGIPNLIGVVIVSSTPFFSVSLEGADEELEVDRNSFFDEATRLGSSFDTRIIR